MADDKCDDCGEPMANHSLELELAVPVNDLRALTLAAIFTLAVLSDGMPLEEAKTETLARLDANHGGIEGLEKVLEDAQAAIRHGVAVLRQHTARNN